jgi:hypothetical protein
MCSLNVIFATFAWMRATRCASIALLGLGLSHCAGVAPESGVPEAVTVAPAVDTRVDAAPAFAGAMPEQNAHSIAGAPATVPASTAMQSLTLPAPGQVEASQAQAALPNPVAPAAAGAPAPAVANAGAPIAREMLQATAVGTTNEWPADCEEHYRFMAHGSSGSASPRHVVPPGSEQVMNFYFEQPWHEARQLLKSRFIFDNTKIIHHWGLFVTSAQIAPGTVVDKDNLLEAVNLLGVQFFLGGGANNSELELPPDVGLRVPALPNQGFWLQVHYLNSSDSPQEDASGIEMCLTSKPRQHEAAVHALGKSSFQLPAKAETTITSTCKPSKLTAPVHIVAISPHMHATGKRATISLNRNGAAAPVFDQPFDVHEQRNYVVPSRDMPSEVLVSPGDTLATSCQYDNTTNAVIKSGSLNEEEMCTMLVWAWPAQQLNNGLQASPELGVPAEEDCTER